MSPRMMETELTCPTYWAKIYIAGPVPIIEQICREYVMKGGCVTVTPTNYIYTMGEESGVEIGMINYPRFPKGNPEVELFNQAVELGNNILEQCCQGSYTIMTPQDTYFFSRRKKDELSQNGAKNDT